VHYEIDLGRPIIIGSGGKHTGRLRANPEGQPKCFESVEQVRQEIEQLELHNVLIIRVHDDGQEEIVSEP
jgi:hypothetical protein